MASTAPSRPDQLTRLLVASTMGVYLLIAVGVTTALTDAVSACPTWPLCGTGPFAALGDLALAVTLAHRAVALVVAGVLVATLWVAWRRGATRRVRLALGTAGALYPVQVGVGALTAVSAAPAWLSALHLVTAMVLFSALLVALLWQLEADTPAEGDVADETAGEPAPAPEPPAGRFPTLRAYLTLTKPKLWWLLALVALAAMALAAGPALELGVAAATIAGGVLAIAASGTFNNVLERDRDRRMARTNDRPIATERIPARRAAAFGLALTLASAAVFLAYVNALAAALGMLAILFYSVVYTLVLKPHTDQNTVLGGAAGAFPALIGWAAIENTLGVEAVALAAVIFLWTPAHFYNLALVYRQDYERAGFPMLPVVRGAAVTRRHVTLYLGATMLAAVLLGTVQGLDWLYALTAVGVGALFLWAVVRQFAERTDASATRTFMASNAYLGLLLVAVLLDTLVV
ncbi:MAG: heme o synthase [Halobacteriales archaeon]|nr:heme o synthase [Halobacteriales archaeon]